jgi:hypothetical protein
VRQRRQVARRVMTLIPPVSLPADGLRPENPDAAKALVTIAIAVAVEMGGAAIAALESGSLELRLATGEIFHLREGTIARVA